MSSGGGRQPQNPYAGALSEILDSLQATVYRIRPYAHKVSRFLLFLLIASCGAELEHIFGQFIAHGQYLQGTIFLDTTFQWRTGWFIITAFVLWIIWVWESRNNKYFLHEDRLAFTLRAFYDWMGFKKKLTAGTAIRCTIWVPTRPLKITKQGTEESSIHMYQVADYYPVLRPLGTTSWHSTHGKGRVFRVAAKASSTVYAIGILGQSVLKALSDGLPEPLIETIAAGTDFEKLMCDKWHFSPKQAAKLTHDRRAYLCIPLIDRGQTTLYGVLYCDSNAVDAFPPKVCKRALEYVPTFGNVLTEED